MIKSTLKKILEFILQPIPVPLNGGGYSPVSRKVTPSPTKGSGVTKFTNEPNKVVFNVEVKKPLCKPPRNYQNEIDCLDPIWQCLITENELLSELIEYLEILKVKLKLRTDNKLLLDELTIWEQEVKIWRKNNE